MVIMTRKILRVIIGYIIFVANSLAFFHATGRKPHADPTYKVMMVATVYGAVSSFIVGLISKLIAGASVPLVP